MSAESLFPEVLQATVHYSGRVQGVGFRYQTHRVAAEYEVAGYVQNLNDGRVLLVAEGQAAEVEAFLRAVEERLEGYIRKFERCDRRAPPSYRGFQIQ